jgi:hypothetical protein
VRDSTATTEGSTRVFVTWWSTVIRHTEHREREAGRVPTIAGGQKPAIFGR